jgi:hypothetical protein
MSNEEQQRQIRESIQHVADRAATKAVHDTLLLLGIDTENPIRAQEEFALLRRLANTMNDPRTVDNLAFLERLHVATDRVADTGFRTIIRVAITAALGLLALMTRDYWLSHFWRG